MPLASTDHPGHRIDFAMALRCVRSLAPLGLTRQEQSELETAQMHRIARMAPGLTAMTIVSVSVPPMIFYGVNGFDNAFNKLPWMALVVFGALALCAFIWPLRLLDGVRHPDLLRRKRRQLSFVASAALFCVGSVVLLGRPEMTGTSEGIFLLIYVAFIGMAAFACTIIASYSNPLVSAVALVGLITPFLGASIVNAPTYAPYLVPFLLIFTACFWLLGINAFQNFLQLEVNSLDRQRQKDVITLLLGEIESQSSDWVWETDAEGNFTHVPPQMLKASGGSVQKGHALSDLLPIAGCQTWAKLLAATKAGRSFRNLDVAIGALGEQRFWRMSGTPRREEQGGYRGVGSDITEQTLAKQAQQESDLLVRSIVEASPTTFLVSRVDDGKVIYQPPLSRDRFGDITSTLEFFTDPEDRVAYLNALLPTGAVNDYPVHFKRQDGSIMEGLTSARVIEYRNEQVIISSTRDVTDLKAMEAELEAQRAAVRQNEKMSALGGLLAGVSHELSNPLSIVAGYALMLREQIKDPGLSQKVERIEEAADRCSRISKTSLAIARERPTQVERCDLNGIVQTAWEIAGGDLRAIGGEGQLRLEPSLPEVEIDADQLVQVFSNLILNAGQAMSETRDAGRPAILSIGTAHDISAGQVVVTFKDTGPGVPQDIAERVFDPFFTTKPVGSGTGIGLALSHRIVAAHQGHLSLVPTRGAGAIFAVRLPVPPHTPIAQGGSV